VRAAVVLYAFSSLPAIPGCSPQQQEQIKQAQQHEVSWSGDVDDSATVYFQGGKSWVDNVTGKPVQNAVATFHGNLPSDVVTASLQSHSGRGQVAITQQPTRDNNYTVAVRIVDPEPSSDHYAFVVTW
jgi:hypothetical protein